MTEFVHREAPGAPATHSFSHFNQALHMQGLFLFPFTLTHSTDR